MPSQTHSDATLAYVSHSGFGHQLQMLMRGLFLSHVTNRTLLVPPLMTHRGSLDIAGIKGCVGQRQIWEYKVKTDLLHASNKQQQSKCSTESDSFFRVFDLSSYRARDISCPRSTDPADSVVPPFVPPCKSLHDTLTVATPPASGTGFWGCDNPVSVMEALVGRW